MVAILTFFVAHWMLSLFMQTFFHHRYGAHRMFTMTKGWERFFHLAAVFFQGSSYLNPRAYAILHREHHAFSDTEKDPHSPHFYTNAMSMMWATKERYFGILSGEVVPEKRFDGGYPDWASLDRFADSWLVRLAFGAAYTAFYVAFAPSWGWFLLLPIHFVMGPFHGAIVNWVGHKYGYRNFASDDKSKNSLPWDFLMLGELFQNNHHKYGQSPNFAVRAFELDPTWQVMKVLAAFGIIKFEGKIQKTHWKPADRVVSEAPPLAESMQQPSPAE